MLLVAGDGRKKLLRVEHIGMEIGEKKCYYWISWCEHSRFVRGYGQWKIGAHKIGDVQGGICTIFTCGYQIRATANFLAKQPRAVSEQKIPEPEPGSSDTKFIIRRSTKNPLFFFLFEK